MLSLVFQMAVVYLPFRLKVADRLLARLGGGGGDGDDGGGSDEDRCQAVDGPRSLMILISSANKTKKKNKIK